MGKVPKFKNKAPSAKSRAARRAASPSDAPDRSLEPTNGHSDAPDPDLSVLSARAGGGVSKKKKQKPLSRQQRLRKEKGMARADAVIDKLETKVKRSKDKGKLIKNRSAAWEDLNNEVEDRKSSKKTAHSEKPTLDATTQHSKVDDVAMALEDDASPTSQIDNVGKEANTMGIEMPETIDDIS